MLTRDHNKLLRKLSTQFKQFKGQRDYPWTDKVSVSHLFNFIEVSYLSSLYMEESRPTRCQLLLVAPSNFIRFRKPVEFNPKGISKLAPVVGQSGRKIVVSPLKSKLAILGLVDDQLTPAFGKMKLEDTYSYLSLEIDGPGIVRIGPPFSVEFLRDETVLSGQLEDSRAINDLVELEFGDLPIFSNNAAVTFGVPILALDQVLKKIRAVGHGGTLLLCPSRAIAECRGYFDGGHILHADLLGSAGKLFLKAIKLLDKGNNFGEAAWEFSHLFNRAAEFIAGLACVDGAVVLTPSLVIRRFGVRIKAPLRKNVPRELKTRMTRHSSAFAFVKKVRSAVAIVISQDGDVSVLSAKHGVERVLTTD